MMATDRLCRMLDELGIEYVSIGGITNWGHAEYDELADGSDTRLIVLGATPEQAIAATVGAGTCHVKAAKKLGDLFGFSLSCGHSMVNQFDDRPDYCPWCGARVVDE